MNDKGNTQVDSVVSERDKVGRQVDPEFVYEVKDGNFTVAYLMVVSSFANVEYWMLKLGWSAHSPGKGGPKTWTYTPVAKKGVTGGGYSGKYPVDTDDQTARDSFSVLYGAAGDVMRKHTVEFL